MMGTTDQWFQVLIELRKWMMDNFWPPEVLSTKGSCPAIFGMKFELLFDCQSIPLEPNKVLDFRLLGPQEFRLYFSKRVLDSPKETTARMSK